MVQPGAQIGRQLGFPTANVTLHNELLPPNGVYVVRAHTHEGSLRGVANLGIRPTLADDRKRILEVHILDFTGDLYGHKIEVEFLEFLRPEIPFENKDALKNQIAQDVIKTREWFAENDRTR
jgi:riboflavin kinase/FMN adenylyltransferase